MAIINPFPHYSGFTQFTPVVPELYWNVYSQEERIKALCMEYVKLTEFTDSMADTLNDQYAIIEEMREQFPQLVNEDVIAEIRRLIDAGEFDDILQAEADRFLEEKTAQITANTEAIAVNRASITENTEAIAVNRASITTLSHEVDHISQVFTHSFETVAQMKADEDLAEGMIADTLGFYSAGDGGASSYIIVDNAEANEMDIIQLNNGYYAVFKSKCVVSPDMFGAKGDGETDDSDKIAKACEYGSVTFSEKTYRVEKPIIINNPAIVDLNNATVDVVGADTLNRALFLVKSENFTIKNGFVKSDSHFLTNYSEGSYYTSNVVVVFSDVVTNVTIDNLYCDNCYILHKNDYKLGETATGRATAIFTNSTIRGFGVAFGAHINVVMDNVTELPISNPSQTGKAHAVYIYGDGNVNINNCLLDCSSNTGYRGIFNNRIGYGNSNEWKISNSKLIGHAVYYTESDCNVVIDNCEIINTKVSDNVGVIEVNSAEVTANVTVQNCNIDTFNIFRGGGINWTSLTLGNINIVNNNIKCSNNGIDIYERSSGIKIYLSDNKITAPAYIINCPRCLCDIISKNNYYKATASNFMNATGDARTNIRFMNDTFDIAEGNYYAFWDNSSSEGTRLFRGCHINKPRYNSEIGSPASAYNIKFCSAGDNWIS